MVLTLWIVILIDKATIRNLSTVSNVHYIVIYSLTPFCHLEKNIC